MVRRVRAIAFIMDHIGPDNDVEVKMQAGMRFAELLHPA